MKNKIISIFIIGLLFSACTPTPPKQESAFIVIKTPTMKYADMGFISTSDTKVKVEIYAAGQPLMDFEINALNICMSAFECMDKETFNEKVLSSSYSSNLLENIFRAKPIFEKEGLEKTEEGFVQKITKEGAYDISYVVKGTTRTFRDTINKILIKVREQ